MAKAWITDRLNKIGKFILDTLIENTDLSSKFKQKLYWNGVKKESDFLTSIKKSKKTSLKPRLSNLTIHDDTKDKDILPNLNKINKFNKNNTFLSLNDYKLVRLRRNTIYRDELKKILRKQVKNVLVCTKQYCLLPPKTPEITFGTIDDMNDTNEKKSNTIDMISDCLKNDPIQKEIQNFDSTVETGTNPNIDKHDLLEMKSSVETSNIFPIKNSIETTPSSIFKNSNGEKEDISEVANDKIQNVSNQNKQENLNNTDQHSLTNQKNFFPKVSNSLLSSIEPFNRNPAKKLKNFHLDAHLDNNNVETINTHQTKMFFSTNNSNTLDNQTKNIFNVSESDKLTLFSDSKLFNNPAILQNQLLEKNLNTDLKNTESNAILNISNEEIDPNSIFNQDEKQNGLNENLVLNSDLNKSSTSSNTNNVKIPNELNKNIFDSNIAKLKLNIMNENTHKTALSTDFFESANMQKISNQSKPLDFPSDSVQIQQQNSIINEFPEAKSSKLQKSSSFNDVNDKNPKLSIFSDSNYKEKLAAAISDPSNNKTNIFAPEDSRRSNNTVDISNSSKNENQTNIFGKTSSDIFSVNNNLFNNNILNSNSNLLHQSISQDKNNNIFNSNINSLQSSTTVDKPESILNSSNNLFKTSTVQNEPKISSNLDSTALNPSSIQNETINISKPNTRMIQQSTIDDKSNSVLTTNNNLLESSIKQDESNNIFNLDNSFSESSIIQDKPTNIFGLSNNFLQNSISEDQKNSIFDLNKGSLQQPIIQDNNNLNMSQGIDEADKKLKINQNFYIPPLPIDSSQIFEINANANKSNNFFSTDSNSAINSQSQSQNVNNINQINGFNKFLGKQSVNFFETSEKPSLFQNLNNNNSIINVPIIDNNSNSQQNSGLKEEFSVFNNSSNYLQHSQINGLNNTNFSFENPINTQNSIFSTNLLIPESQASSFPELLKSNMSESNNNSQTNLFVNGQTHFRIKRKKK